MYSYTAFALKSICVRTQIAKIMYFCMEYKSPYISPYFCSRYTLPLPQVRTVGAAHLQIFFEILLDSFSSLNFKISHSKNFFYFFKTQPILRDYLYFRIINLLEIIHIDSLRLLKS